MRNLGASIRVGIAIAILVLAVWSPGSAHAASSVIPAFESHYLPVDPGVFGYDTDHLGNFVDDDGSLSQSIYLFDLSGLSETVVAASLELHITEVDGPEVEGGSPPPYFRGINVWQVQATQADLDEDLNLVDADALGSLLPMAVLYGGSGAISFPSAFPAHDASITLNGTLLIDMTAALGNVFILSVSLGTPTGGDGGSLSFDPALTTLSVETPEPSAAGLLALGVIGLVLLRRRARPC